jgi:hypothetical protein
MVVEAREPKKCERCEICTLEKVIGTNISEPRDPAVACAKAWQSMRCTVAHGVRRAQHGAQQRGAAGSGGVKRFDTNRSQWSNRIGR